MSRFQTYFRVPEPSGRTFAELDLLFERGVSARKFKSTNVDVFDETVDDSVLNRYDEQILQPERMASIQHEKLPHEADLKI